MVKDAEFVSVWDGGIEVTAGCKVNMETKRVFDIEKARVDGLDVLEEEHIIIDGIIYPVFEKLEREDDGFWYDF